MPMILLAIRVEMEVILKMNFNKFLENKPDGHGPAINSNLGKNYEEVCMRLVNGVITELLDSNVYYSRLSFLESGKEAIDLKHKISQLGNQKSSSDKKQKFYTRSALVKNLIPMPSEGKVRALFTDGQSKLSQAGQMSIFGLS